MANSYRKELIVSILLYPRNEDWTESVLLMEFSSSLTMFLRYYDTYDKNISYVKSIVSVGLEKFMYHIVIFMIFSDVILKNVNLEL